MTATRTLIFDVNETLLDLAPLREVVAELLDGRDELVPLWFSSMLHYSLAHNLIADYRPFPEIGAATLQMVGESQDISVDREAAQDRIVESMTHLPAHEDIEPGLKALKEGGYRLVCLTNSTSKGVQAQIENAGLSQYFERLFSVEEVQAYKPDARPYQHVVAELGIEAGECLMVAAHPWDLMGAEAAGLQSAFIRRQGTALYPNAERPTYVVDDLQALAKALQQQ